MDMGEKLERIGRLRRTLEPLAMLYKKAVLDTRKMPFEVRLTAHQSTDHLSENYHGEDTVHIIGGESLHAAHEVWREYRRIEMQLLEQSGKATSNESDLDPQLDELAYLSASEREWLEWFYCLSDEDKKIVEEYGEIDISVTPANFDQVQKAVSDLEANAANSVVQPLKA